MSYLPVSRHAPKLARSIVIVVSLALCAMAFLHVVWLALGFGPTALCGCYMALLLGIQLGYFNRPVPGPPSPLDYLVLSAQTALVYLPFLQYEQAWVGMPGFLAGSALLALPLVAGLPAFVGVVVSMAAIQSLYSGDPIQIVYTTLSTTITGMVIYGLTRLAALVSDLHAARGELARMAVAQERLRFARDLHDLLGYSLSAITLKSELTHRLMATAPGRAQAELEEILQITRRALADVRSVASGQRTLSLDSETRSVRSVLASADVEVRMTLEYENLPERVATLLATILREGITNVLRHSKAEHCAVTICQTADTVVLTLINDGARKDRSRGSGNGTRNLSNRVTALGGSLTSGPFEDHKFRLVAMVPLREEEPEPAEFTSA